MSEKLQEYVVVHGNVKTADGWKTRGQAVMLSPEMAKSLNEGTSVARPAVVTPATWAALNAKAKAEAAVAADIKGEAPKGEKAVAK